MEMSRKWYRNIKNTKSELHHLCCHLNIAIIRPEDIHSGGYRHGNTTVYWYTLDLSTWFDLLFEHVRVHSNNEEESDRGYSWVLMSSSNIVNITTVNCGVVRLGYTHIIHFIIAQGKDWYWEVKFKTLSKLFTPSRCKKVAATLSDMYLLHLQLFV